MLDQFLYKQPTVNSFPANHLYPVYSYSSFTEWIQEREHPHEHMVILCKSLLSCGGKKGRSKGDWKAGTGRWELPEHALPFSLPQWWKGTYEFHKAGCVQ